MSSAKFLSLCLASMVAMSAFGAPRIQYKIDVTDTSCGGFPKLPVKTFEGSCLGLISKEAMVFPRKILELESNRFLITDMGGWKPIDRGVLWELDLRNGQNKLTKRAQGLLTPHDIQFGPDGNVYIGERGRVTRWKKSELLVASKVVSGEIVIGNLLAEFDGKEHRHPLMKFAFGLSPSDQGDLYINMGSSSDDCIAEEQKICTAGEKTGLIRHYKYDASQGRWAQKGTTFARGLRNSVGLLSHPSGTLLQAENSQDFSSAAEPYDEINVVVQNRHYGWPYCYNFVATSPNFKFAKCGRDYSSPYLLLPPHVAPLDMQYYNSDLFPALRGHLLMSWHGYRATGSRIVGYPVNDKGQPVLSATKDWSFNEYTDDGVKSTPAKPTGGSYRAAEYKELVSLWSEKIGVRPAGAPVGLLVASDGRILIIEDKNRSVLILTKDGDGDYGDSDGISPEEQARIDAGVAKMIATPQQAATYQELSRTIFQPVCATCHDKIPKDERKALEYFVGRLWVIPGDADSLMLERVLSTDPSRRMPFGGSLQPSQRQMIQDWIMNAR